MLIGCPNCKTKFRVTEINPTEKVIKYFCNSCQRIVSIDLIKDEIKHTSSAQHIAKLDFKKLVLVADDATFICQMIEKLLTPAGYRVICADDGLMALKMAKEHHPDIIILDLLMPRMTGFDVLRELKKNDATRDTPVLVMSGVYTNTREIGFIQGLGAAGFIHKDALDENLIFRVNTLLQVPAT